MKLSRAIQILSADETDRHPDTNPEVNDATKLGIEALKEVARARRLGPPLESYRLPGETED